MSPKKFFKYVVKVKKHIVVWMEITMNLSIIILIFMGYMFKASFNTCAIVAIILMTLYEIGWAIINHAVDKKLFSMIDDRIIMENKELVKLLTEHKVEIPSHLGPIIREMDKIQPKDI